MIHKCPNCDGNCGKREYEINHGWVWRDCYLCDGRGKVSQEILDKDNRRIQLLEAIYDKSNEEYGDILYGKGEKWGPI
jgi:RecJ-like exonuclease